jgi:Zn-dependent peptidase ImmA (M78 family)/DNA-binding XRE family transcriptional regulator
MAVGERLKMARLRAGLSQRDLAREAGVSAQAVSKYERGLDMPGSGVLLRLARALDVKVEFLLRPKPRVVVSPVFRCRSRLSARKRDAILARIQEWLERYLDVESLLDIRPQFELPDSFERQASSMDDVERVALQVREAWDLGLDSIESLVDALEEHGVKVYLVDASDGFDACSFRAGDNMPVIAVRDDVPGDRQRFDLAHELGHLVLEPAPHVDVEKAAHRFAGAFLVPEPVVRAELGERRRTLSPYELHMLKHRYGLSMQAWIYRAGDLGILSPAATRGLFRDFRRRRWHKREPGDQIPQEKPKRLQRLVMRALAEDLVSRSRAAELLGEPLNEFLKRESQQHGLVFEPVRD